MMHFLRFSPLLLLGVPVCLATGCNVEPEIVRCVDYQDRVVPYSACSLPSQSVKVAGSLYPLPSHRLYYGGYGGTDFGNRAWGGSDKPLRGHAYQAPTADDDPVASNRSSGSDPYVVIPRN